MHGSNVLGLFLWTIKNSSVPYYPEMSRVYMEAFCFLVACHFQETCANGYALKSRQPCVFSKKQINIYVYIILLFLAQELPDLHVGVTGIVSSKCTPIYACMYTCMYVEVYVLMYVWIDR